MDFDFWQLFSVGLAGVGSIFGRKLTGYFGDQAKGVKRTHKAMLAQQIVSGVVDYLSLSKAYSQERAVLVKQAIAVSTQQLILNGFSPVKAQGIAEREVARSVKHLPEEPSS